MSGPYEPEPGARGIHGIIVANGVLRNFSQVAGRRMPVGSSVFAR